MLMRDEAFSGFSVDDIPKAMDRVDRVLDDYAAASKIRSEKLDTSESTCMA